MRFKIDENLPAEAAHYLRHSGFECDSVYDEQLQGVDDRRVAERCRTDGRILLTLDLDFANVAQYPPSEYPGFIVLRIGEQSKQAVLDAFERVLPLLRQHSPEKSLWVVTERDVRVKR